VKQEALVITRITAISPPIQSKTQNALEKKSFKSMAEHRLHQLWKDQHRSIIENLIDEEPLTHYTSHGVLALMNYYS